MVEVKLYMMMTRVQLYRIQMVEVKLYMMVTRVRLQDTNGGGETVQEDSQNANGSQTETPMQLNNSEKESPEMDFIEVVDTDQLQACVFVITKYDDISYIGKVTDVEEDEIEVSFTTTHGRG